MTPPIDNSPLSKLASIHSEHAKFTEMGKSNVEKHISSMSRNLRRLRSRLSRPRCHTLGRCAYHLDILVWGDGRLRYRPPRQRQGICNLDIRLLYNGEELSLYLPLAFLRGIISSGGPVGFPPTTISSWNGRRESPMSLPQRSASCLAPRSLVAQS